MTVADKGAEIGMSGKFLEDLAVGQSAEHLHTVEERDIVAFAEVSGDRNPVHLNADYAAETQFKGRIAHGMLSAAYISAVLGMTLPGPGAVYLSQTLTFKRPVRIGDTVAARASILSIDHAKARITLKTECLVLNKVVLEGEAVVMVPRRTQPASASSSGGAA
jgi:3-hydroxybutyryl-CoA dehydratase